MLLETTTLPFNKIEFSELPFAAKYLFTNTIWKQTEFIADVVCRKSADNYKEYVIEAKTFQYEIMQGVNIWPFLEALELKGKANIISVVVYTDNSFTIQFEMR